MEEWLLDDQGGHGFVSAVAGSGKSSVLTTSLVSVLPKRVLFLSFNKSVAAKLTKETGGLATCKTLHTFGYHYYLPNTKIFASKQPGGPQMKKIIRTRKGIFQHQFRSFFSICIILLIFRIYRSKVGNS